MKHRKGKWKAAKPAAANARRELPLFVEEYFSEGRKAASKDVSAAELHQFRLLTKHLRYTLELFRGLYGPAMDAYLARLRKVQTVLGDLNDYAATASLVAEMPEAAQEDTRRLLAALAQKERRKRREFARLWKREFDAPGEQRRWTIYLSRYARERGAGV